MTQDIVPLARITPHRRAVVVQGNSGRRFLTPRAKAAIIVRYLLTEGATLPLASLPEHMQAALAEQMGQMRLIDRDTLDKWTSKYAHYVPLRGFEVGREDEEFGGGTGNVRNTVLSRSGRSASARHPAPTNPGR